MSFIRSLVAGSLLCMPIVLSSAALAGGCKPPLPHMASHGNAVPHFKSVAIAVHGWSGACSGTFGKGRKNMLEVLKSHGAFDVDCFDYDSHQGTIDEARVCLRERLKRLRNNGYREFAFITHSTGGIVALDLILSEAENESDLIFHPDSGIKLKGLFAWAAPINGVTEVIATGSRIKKVWDWLRGTQERILPSLIENSTYLNSLQSRLIAFDQSFATPGTSVRKKFNLHVLQGQWLDGVVNSASPSDDWWPKNLNAEFVATRRFHIDNVGSPGTIDAPEFPAVVQLKDLNLLFDLRPRFDPYFSSAAMPAHDHNRKAIAESVFRYSSHESLFSNETSKAAISILLSRLFSGGYRRSSAQDENFANRFVGLLKNWFENQNKETAYRTANSLLERLHENLAIVDPSDPTTFGGGSRRALRNLACGIQGIFLKVAGRNRSVQRASLGPTGDDRLREFEESTLKLTDRMLRMTGEDPAASRCVRSIIAEAAPTADPVAIFNSNLIANIQEYRINNPNMSDPVKKDFADVFVALTKRTETANAAFAYLVNETKLAGKPEAPFWTTILSDNQSNLLATNAALIAPKSATFSDFAASVYARAGTSANKPKISIDIGEAFLKAYQNQPASEKAEAYNIILNATEGANYEALLKSRILPQFREMKLQAQ